MSIVSHVNAWWTRLRAPRLANKSVQQAKAALDATYGAPTTPIGRFNRDSAATHGWDPTLLHQLNPTHAPQSWDDRKAFQAIQLQLQVDPDGWFGPTSYRALMRQFPSHLIAGGYPHPAPPGIHVRNWYAKDAGVRPFPPDHRRGRTVNQAVAHESVTATWQGCQEVLLSRGLGVHLMVTPDTEGDLPVVTQHADLLWDRLTHAGSQNGPSVAIEYISPYYPEAPRQIAPNLPVLEDLGWADDGRDREKNYRMLPQAMLEAGTTLLAWLTMPEGPIGIPRDWRGWDKAAGRFALNRVGGDPRRPGVWAHTYTAHADGAVPVLYAWLRLERGLPPSVAYAEAMRLAGTSARWARV